MAIELDHLCPLWNGWDIVEGKDFNRHSEINACRIEATYWILLHARIVLGIVLFLSAGLPATNQAIYSQRSPTIHLNLPPDIPLKSFHINYFMTGPFGGYGGFMAPDNDHSDYEIIAAVDGKPARGEGKDYRLCSRMPDRNSRYPGATPDSFTAAIVRPSCTEDLAWTNHARTDQAAAK